MKQRPQTQFWLPTYFSISITKIAAATKTPAVCDRDALYESRSGNETGGDHQWLCDKNRLQTALKVYASH